MRFSQTSTSTLFFTFAALTIVAYVPQSYSARAEEDRTIERIVAVVNGQPIFFSELTEMTDRFVDEMKVTKKESAIGDPKDLNRRVLDQLINEKLLEDEIARRGLSANDGMIDAELTRVMQEHGMRSLSELKSALQREGLEFEEYRSQIKKQIERSILVNDLVRSKVQVTDADVEAAYRRNTAEQPKQLQSHVRMIFKAKGKGDAIKTEMKTIKGKLSGGVPFEKLANQETEGPGKGAGGDIGLVSPGDLQPELSKVLAKLKAGEISDVINTDQGYYILQCVEKVEVAPRSLGDMKESLREGLIKLQTEQQYDAFVRGLRDKAQIEVML